mmetsp:Transcript_36822/g.82502  ORF Transcript_36822/g.82502 Transcript_36822/m.82502 type:complete len:262 (-) Transcript_36822:66-851(-)
MLECAVAVADFRELLVDPRLFHGTLVARRLDGLPLALRVRALRVFCLKRPVNLFGGDHPRFDGRVAALDLDRVEEARGASDEGASWKGELRDGVEAALVERPRAVRNAPPARKVRRDRGVVLEPLELVVRAQMWVLVVEAHHHTHQDQVGFHVVEEGSAEGLVQGPVLQGPPQRVLHVAGLKALAGHLPHLLKAEPVRLLVTTLAKNRGKRGREALTPIQNAYSKRLLKTPIQNTYLKRPLKTPIVNAHCKRLAKSLEGGR